MNKKIIISFVIILVLLILGYYIFVKNIYKGKYEQIQNNNKDEFIEKNIGAPNLENNFRELEYDVLGNVITKEELVKHNKEDDCWVVYKGEVYDVTKFLPIHPGGLEKITQFCGTDKFESAFIKKHGDSTDKKLEVNLEKDNIMKIGEIK